MKSWTFLLLGAALSLTESWAEVVTFEDLPNLPAANTASDLGSANNGSLLYKGITWDGSITVHGDEYRVDPITPGPLLGMPQSGHYFIVNNNGGSISLVTDLILTGAWFARAEYYGFGAGADQVTIVALKGVIELAQVTVDIPNNVPGDIEPMVFADTAGFLGLSDITGYRIDRRAPVQYADNWVGDDFQFVPAPASVPEPADITLLGSGLLIAAGWICGRKPGHLEWNPS